MAKVRINFMDFAGMLYDCEDAYHFEAVASEEEDEIKLKLFIDGKQSDYEMSINIAGLAQVAKEMTL